MEQNAIVCPNDFVHKRFWSHSKLCCPKCGGTDTILFKDLSFFNRLRAKKLFEKMALTTNEVKHVNGSNCTLEDRIKDIFPFKDFRANQKESILETLTAFEQDELNYVILEAPVGSGKSVSAYTVAKYLISKLSKAEKDNRKKPYALICTSSKTLQTQYIKDFPDVEYLWSAKNYPCALHPNADDVVYFGSPLCKGKQCEKRKRCKYLIQKKKFYDSNIGVTNYHYYFNSCSLRPDILIFDEAHNVPVILPDIYCVNISKLGLEIIKNTVNKYSLKHTIRDETFVSWMKDLSRFVKMSPDEIETVFPEFCRNINIVLNKLCHGVEKELAESQAVNSGGLDAVIIGLAKTYTRLSSLCEKLNNYVKAESKYIVSEVNKDKLLIKIKPLLSGDLFDKIKTFDMKLLMMSGTICGVEEFAKDLNVGYGEYRYITIPSVFPVKNRKFYVKPVCRLNYQNQQTTLPIIVKNINSIIDGLNKNIGVSRGIIHTVSYRNAEYIKDTCKHNKRIYIPTKEDLMNFNEFVKDKPDAIIASPAISEGLDLVDDLSRFQIFIKVPYAFLGDRWVKTRMQISNEWYAREAILKIVQGSGRSVRSMDDYAITIMLDENFNMLLDRNSHLFPQYFLDAVQYVPVN